MNLLRGQLLTTGPLALIAACYFIAAPSATSNRVEELLPQVLSGRTQMLTEDCQTVADQLQQQLSREWNVVIHEPFVIAGDCGTEQLDRCHRETIAPTAQALAVQYFDLHPAWPITVVLCSSDESHRECNQQLHERARSEYSGIYSRSQHRVIVNIATGEGTLAHELTHALAHADFPDMPEWLDEGLASLYEECEFSADGLHLVGQENWRGVVVRQALKTGRLRTLVEMAGEPFAKQDASVEYAQARYFCLYLQQRHLLEPFYRKCRTHSKSKRDSLDSLVELTGATDPRAFEREFRTWLAKVDSVR